MAKHNAVGKWGEDLAVEKLVRDGYAIMERNWHLPPYEIDIIAAKGKRIAFCEVKTRSDRDEDPLAAITAAKIAHMAKAADVYVRTHDVILEPQFDIFAVSGTADDYKLEHIPDAFFPPLKCYK